MSTRVLTKVVKFRMHLAEDIEALLDGGYVVVAVLGAKEGQDWSDTIYYHQPLPSTQSSMPWWATRRSSTSGW